ncbi:hypothetical protein [Psychromonas sp. L1A2]|uniref:hypothetical protein n=1 Tax=Psychromonas sp. L1A2 TaxID=2686356 RepID=UPI00135AF3F2|nr:hypothetical protein [Psychromonas sp. L1A2]
MKINNNSLLKLTILSALPTISVQASELNYLYKDQRTMAMGGANVSVGGYSSSLFSNPAGIAKVTNKDDLTIEFFTIQASGGKDTGPFVSDLNDAIDTDDRFEVAKTIANYSGKSIHADASNYSSITKNSDQYAWSLGLLTAVDANFTPYADEVEIQARSYGGLTGAFTYTFQPSRAGELSLGFGLKIITQQSYEGVLTAIELIFEDDITGKIKDDLQDDGVATSADLGFIYQLNTNMKPSFGMSILNIGELDFDGHYGSQPMTLNFGASIQPQLVFSKHTVIAIDYIDALNASKTRYYDSSTGSFASTKNNDFEDRLRIGISARVFENRWSALDLLTGLYQGSYTAGFTYNADIFRIGFATYEEGVNSLRSTETDRRYNLSVGITW